MKRVLELDGLRGLAALAVVGFHLFPGYVPMGWISVDCFFVLSGYLISTILLTNSKSTSYFRNFYVRRNLRIWPIYYLTLTWVVVSYQIFPTKYPIDGGMIAQYATYTQGLQRLWGGPERSIKALSHTWTLAIEEQFYMIWPLTVWLIPRRSLVPSCVALTVMAVGLRLMGMDGTMLPARCDGFALGTILAVLVAEASSAPRRLIVLRGLLLAAISAGGAGATIIVSAMVRLPGLTNVALLIGFANLIFAGLIGWLVLDAGRPWATLFRWRPLVYLGTISYGLYLYHIPVMFAVEAVARRFGSGMRFDGSRSLSRSAIDFAISLVIAALSWRFIERPILRLKERFSYRREPGPVSESRGPEYAGLTAPVG